MESSRRDDALTATLEALRPAPAPAFAAELDERAATGFPRRGLAGGSAPWAPLVERLRALTPRQVLLPSLAAAFVAVVVATALVATSKPRFSFNSEVISSRPHLEHAPEASGEVQGSAASAGAEADVEAAPSVRAAALPPGAAHRDVERSAQVVLGAEPDAISGDAAKVYEAVHAARGIVLRSSTSEGAEAGAAGAHFELLIPSTRLDDALGAISEIDEVLSRRDGTADITAPTVDVSERLQDSQAKVDSLLNELAASETELERETIEAELGAARRRASFLRSQLNALHRRASFSHVSVRIEGNSPGAASGGWDLGDALHDAGRVLAVAAGVVLIGLAVLAPIALIALALWLGRRAWVRQGRRRVLE